MKGESVAGSWLATLSLLVAVAVVVAGNILLKLGAVQLGRTSIVELMLSWRVLCGLGLFAVAVVLYISTLRVLPLQIAQSFMVLQYAGVIVASYLILGEQISGLRLVGMSLIGVGVFIVSRT